MNSNELERTRMNSGKLDYGFVLFFLDFCCMSVCALVYLKKGNTFPRNAITVFIVFVGAILIVIIRTMRIATTRTRKTVIASVESTDLYIYIHIDTHI